MSSPMLLVPPAINVIVTGAFTVVILRQYLSRHRVYQFYWSIALGMAFVATIAYMCMIITQPTSHTGILLFRTYYIFGTLMPAWLGMGSVALVGSPLFKRLSLTFLLLLSLVGAIFTLDASIDLQKLSQIAGTPGTGILIPGPWLVTTIILNTLGVVAIVSIAIYSGWKLLRRQSSLGGLRTSNVLWSNLLILVGALLNAAAGGLARFLGIQNTFWLIMALGWIVLFVGVILASHRTSSASSQTLTQNRADPINV